MRPRQKKAPTMPSEFPKNLYRYEDGERIGKLFATPEAVEPGWVAFDDLGSPPPAKPKPAMPTPEAVDAGKRIAGLEAELVRAKDSVKVLETELAAKDRQIAALTAQLAEKGEAPVEPTPKRTRTKA